MKILKESFQDVEAYLRSSDLISKIIKEFGDDFSSYNEEVINFVENEVESQFDDTNIKVEKVVVCKVVGEDVDLINSDHYVINYNGTYYDYTAQEFNDSFNGLIKLTSIPVVQNVIHSDNQLNDKLSTIKGYVLLGY